jgi:hypothetical protein
MSRSTRASCIAAVAALATSLRVDAHGFGQRYDLPLPLSLYLWATALAVALSFVVAVLFMRRSPTNDAYPRVRVPLHPAFRWLALAVRVLSVTLFLVTIAAGFIGNQNPYQNIAPTLIWIIAWVGLVYVSAFVADLWPLIDPWRSLFGGAQRLGRLASRGSSTARVRRYDERIGVWPAFALLLAFAWTELVFPSPALPAHVAWLMVGYSAITFAGMLVYGRDAWVRHGEVFAIVLSAFARFAPLEAGDRKLELRPFAAGLLNARPVSTSMAALVVLILATVLYDGLLGTPQWNDLESWLVVLAPASSEAASIVIRTLGLIAAWGLFFGAYLSVCALMGVAGGRSAMELARVFAPTLIPIAIAYHLAHYLSYLLVQGQYIVPLLSDPFGLGWNLFGTAGYRVDIGIAGARFEWYTAVIAIVTGHVIAVYLAHRRALQLFGRRALALRTQLPLTALMILYTFISLSILAEPITERPSAAVQPASASGSGVDIPADAIVFEAGTGRILPVGRGASAAQKLSYRVLGSAFHDGSAMTAADLVYAYSFAYRWGSGGTETGHYEQAIGAGTAPMRGYLAGVRVVGIDSTSKSFKVAEINVVRELFLVDVYLTKLPEDAEQDAAIAPPWSTVPWHLLALMEEAVSRGWAAFSQQEALRRRVPWLDLARSEQLNKQLASLVDTFERDGYRPEALRSMVSADEARKRWAALAAFYRERGHFLVTNGPYRLKQWSENKVVLDIFRDLSYPLGVGSYDAYAVPRRGFITRVEQERNQIRLFAEIETIMKFQRSYELQRMPLDSVAPDVLQRSAPECRYTVIDEANRVALAGVAAPPEGGAFRIDLNGRLPPGRYIAFAEILVNGNAMNAEIRRIPVTVAAAP